MFARSATEIMGLIMKGCSLPVLAGTGLSAGRRGNLLITGQVASYTTSQQVPASHCPLMHSPFHLTCEMCVFQKEPKVLELEYNMYCAWQKNSCPTTFTFPILLFDISSTGSVTLRLQLLSDLHPCIGGSPQ